MVPLAAKTLSLRAASLAGALTGAAIALVLLIGSFSVSSTELLDVLGTVFVGMALSGPGVFISLVWGFLMGGVFSALFTWIYNHILT